MNGYTNNFKDTPRMICHPSTLSRFLTSQHRLPAVNEIDQPLCNILQRQQRHYSLGLCRVDQIFSRSFIIRLSPQNVVLVWKYSRLKREHVRQHDNHSLRFASLHWLNILWRTQPKPNHKIVKDKQYNRSAFIVSDLQQPFILQPILFACQLIWSVWQQMLHWSLYRFCSVGRLGKTTHTDQSFVACGLLCQHLELCWCV